MLAQAIGYSSEEDVIQNLRDAGCDQETIKCFMKYMDEDDLKGQQLLLKEHREELLDKVHREQKRIDCLDYLVYQMEQNRNQI